jgi:hypothetical protein
MISTNQIFLTLLASIFSGALGVFFNYRKEKKKESIRIAEKIHDGLLIELKDLQIKLYKLEKDLDEWKQKYYEALQELIAVKAELEDSLIKIGHIQIHLEDE